jgi:hypothetical protein
LILSLCLTLSIQAEDLDLGPYIERAHVLGLGQFTRLRCKILYQDKYDCEDRLNHVLGLQSLAIELVDGILEEIYAYKKKPEVREHRKHRKK